jgi:hypothetical protein
MNCLSAMKKLSVENGLTNSTCITDMAMHTNMTPHPFPACLLFMVPRYSMGPKKSLPQLTGIQGRVPLSDLESDPFFALGFFLLLACTLCTASAQGQLVACPSLPKPSSAICGVRRLFLHALLFVPSPGIVWPAGDYYGVWARLPCCIPVGFDCTP